MRYLLILSVLFLQCSSDEERFRLVSSRESGVTFRNVLKEDTDFNIFNYLYFYNGGGVATGDVNDDGLADLYFVANQSDNKLYLNRGGFKFEDVTAESKVGGVNGWDTGVTMADVNGDGKLDIYVSYVGDYLIYKGRNLLYINEGNNEKGVPVFSEQAIQYGLGLVAFSTQAAFFDYDRDDDLDMFLLTHSVHQNGTYGKSTLRKEAHPLAGDKLMRNDGGQFVEVTGSSGIYNSVLGYGLGVAVSDVNMDGWADIYVGNDFHENDYLYINQQDGTFKEELESQIKHTSRYTMGVDFADFNNDLFPDLVTMDMLPQDPLVLKSSMAEDPYDVYHFKIAYGYNHQFARNTLQINNRNGSFSDIAWQANMAATDWSWSTFFADFDLDGKKDLFVANGIKRRSNNLDYINFISSDSVQMKLEGELTSKELRYIEKMPEMKVSNHMFVNQGDSTFADMGKRWGLGEPSYSQGAAYADLDNDGDLDLVVNNLDDEAFVYENRTLSKTDAGDNGDQANFLQVQLKSAQGNTAGVGSKVIVFSSGSSQLQECLPTRGYQSSVEPRLTFGLGATNTIDSILVIWPDGKYEKLTDIKANQKLVVTKEHASRDFSFERFHQKDKPFFLSQASNEALGLSYKHEENSFVEFNREQLIPHMMSAEGPASAVGDINNDGLEDIFIGGAKWQPASIFVQTFQGSFKKLPQVSFEKDATSEDVDAVFVDIDQDEDMDLVVASGGNEFSRQSEYRKQRLYINDGTGNFTRSILFPDVFMTGAAVTTADVDLDGDSDLFFGARTTPWQYGVVPQSYLLINQGNGKFEIDQAFVKSFPSLGMVKDAVLADMNNDQFPDLVVASEWNSLQIVFSDKGILTKENLSMPGADTLSGFWSALAVSDLDLDGDMDIVAGNQGLNGKLVGDKENPIRMYVHDFDKNDSIDQIITYRFGGKEYPVHTRDEITKQMPFLKKRYLSYREYAAASVQELFTKRIMDKAITFEANEFRSGVFINSGNKKFDFYPLPSSAQWSSVAAIEVLDVDKNKVPDLLIAGNMHRLNIQFGRLDASYGLLLKGRGQGRFLSIPGFQSGLRLNGEVKALKKIKIKGKLHIIAIRNNDEVMVVPANESEQIYL